MMRAYYRFRRPLVFASLFVCSVLVLPLTAGFAQDAVVRAADAPLVDVHTEKVMLIASNLGLSAVFLGFLLWSLRRQSSVEALNQRYEEQATANLAAFEQINTRNVDVVRELLAAHQEMNRNMQALIKDSVAATTEMVTLVKGLIRMQDECRDA